MKKKCPILCEIKDDIKTNFYCPKKNCCQTDCVSSVIEYNRIEIMRKFWSIDLFTTCSCSWHLNEKSPSPYIVFYDIKFVENSGEVFETKLELKEAYEVFLRLQEKGNLVCEIVMDKSDYGFTAKVNIDPIKDQLSPKKSLKVQLDFLDFLDKAADEIKKIWIAEERVSKKSEKLDCTTSLADFINFLKQITPDKIVVKTGK